MRMYLEVCTYEKDGQCEAYIEGHIARPETGKPDSILCTTIKMPVHRKAGFEMQVRTAFTAVLSTIQQESKT